MPIQSAMEPARYWMWTRRKLSGRPQAQTLMPLAAASSYSDSWEEQAFAEDFSGQLGGCIWPPRSYSCSFCSREFRSAQALGGHMNVHRRDRARLRQSSISENENNPHNNQPNPCTPLAAQYPPDQFCSVVYSKNPNPNHGDVASPPSPSRVSAVSSQENCTESSLVTPSYPWSVGKEHLKASLFSSPRFLSDSFPLQKVDLPELKLGRHSLKLREMGYQSKRDSDEEESISSKRRRLDESIPFFLRHQSGNRGHLQSDVLALGPNPIEELDLELRL